MNSLNPLTAGAQPVDRDRPDAQFIAAMRERYPTEREIDWAFTRRLQRRAEGPFKAPSLDEMTGHLHRLLREQLSGPYEVRDAAWLGGGGSKLQMRFTLDTEQPYKGHRSRVLVLRMEPAESLNPSSRLREAQIITALQGKVPVPEMYWVDREGRWFPEPALIYSFSSGVAKPTQFSNKRVTGLGTNFGPDLRRKLGLQFVRHLATVHTREPAQADLSSFDFPGLGSTEAARWQVNRALRCWEEDREQPMPLLEVARHWLERNLPTLDHASLIHGDYRSGNFLFDEASGEITAVLDWERCTIGDRHRDIAWATSEAIGHHDESGRRFLVCGLLPLEEFIAEYERASGLKVDARRLHFYTVLCRYQQAATVLGTSYRVVRLRRSHQDILLSRIEAASYVLLEELRQALEAPPALA
jgi:aminoglycoside phosphotransferase (APT) family kinase protein